MTIDRCLPTHDNVILRPLSHEEKTASGIVLAQPGDYSGLRQDKYNRANEKSQEIPLAALRRRTDRFEVVSVGPGAYVDVSDDVGDNVFLRKPMTVAPGDVVVAQEGPKPFPCNGEILYVAKEYQILARITIATDGMEKVEPLNDYIFAKESSYAMKTASGITLVGTEDVTGNEKMPIRFEATEVSKGPYALAYEDGRKPRFERRPMSVAPGDVFAFDGRAFDVNIAGGTRAVVQDYLVACRFVPEAA